MNRLLRRIFCWKFAFYELFLPLLRTLGPRSSDAVLRRLGQILTLVWPGRRARLRNSLMKARDALDLDGSVEDLWPDLAASTARFLARDYTLDCRSDAAVFARFEVLGIEHLERALAAGQGVILVGCHLGAYIAGLHWLFRKRLPVRALVQRPKHVSRELARWFDNAQGPYAQAEMSLRRNLPPAAAAELLCRAGQPFATAWLSTSVATSPGKDPIPGPASCWARHNASWPSGPNWLSSPGHQYSMSSAFIFPAAGSGSSSKLWARYTPARRLKPWLTTSNSSRPGLPLRPLRPSPTCSGPVSILPARTVRPRGHLVSRTGRVPAAGMRLQCRAISPHGVILSLTGFRPTPGKFRLSASLPDSSVIMPVSYRPCFSRRSAGSYRSGAVRL